MARFGGAALEKAGRRDYHRELRQPSADRAGNAPPRKGRVPRKGSAIPSANRGTGLPAIPTEGESHLPDRSRQNRNARVRRVWRGRFVSRGAEPYASRTPRNGSQRASFVWNDSM